MLAVCCAGRAAAAFTVTVTVDDLHAHGKCLEFALAEQALAKKTFAQDL
jgi:hypothetical protein